MRRNEAADYVEGYQRRERGAWERARLQVDALCRVMTGKGCRMRLPWDDERRAEEAPLSKEELDELRRRAKAAEALINRKHG